MKIELHCHTSRYSGCCSSSPEDIIRGLIERGYQGVFITEHDAIWGDWELADLQAAFPEIRIFSGVELAVGEDRRSHLLILGTDDRSYQRIPTVPEILRRADEENHLTILAHPFRWAVEPELLGGEVLPDAIEWQTCNHMGELPPKSLAAAHRLMLPLVNAGDVHSPAMANRFWVQTDQDVTDPGHLRDIIIAGDYENKTAE